MKFIPLNPAAKGKMAIVDDTWHEELMRWKWRISSAGYAQRHGQNIEILMHRCVCAAPKGLWVDHINGNRLDNRRENLRLVTKQENAWHTRKKPNNTHEYKGIQFNKRTGKYTARICFNYKQINIGYYDAPEIAALVYNEAAVELFGEYACLNVLPEGGQPYGTTRAILGDTVRKAIEKVKRVRDSLP